MYRLRLAVIVLFSAGAFVACTNSNGQPYVIGESKAYEASIFRQNCAVCHGPEGSGKVLSDGTKVPSLREGEFKANTEAEIYNQISNGGNGMTPFRGKLTERELILMTRFVRRDLRRKPE